MVTNGIEALVLLLGIAALLTQLARTLNVPYPVFLVLGGLALGFVPGLPAVSVEPEVIFLVFLPPLLNAAAFASSPLELRNHLRPIAGLAIGLVLITTAVVAVAAHLLTGLPWAACFVLGAILGPTDPVAAEAVFGRLGAPERVRTIIGGESLVNDGTGLVAYRAAVAAVVGGSFSLAQAGGDFLLAAGGGIAVGLVLARVVVPLWARLKEASILVAFSVLIPYAIYVLAEEILGVSGVLAVVAYGLYQGWALPRLLPEATVRMQASAFWAVMVFLLEAVLFVLIGQRFPSVLASVGESFVPQAVLYALLVYVVLVVVRMAWFFTVPYLYSVSDRLLGSGYLRAPWQERLAMGWSGMRGAVSLAAALAIPLSTETGSPFPGRDLILFVTISVILLTLVVQGLTLGPLIGALRFEGEDGTLAELEARRRAAQAALARLEQLQADGRILGENGERMRETYEGRVRRYESGIESGGMTEEYARSSAAWRSWRRELLSAEREALLSMRDAGEINQEVLRRIERDLTLEESRIGG